MSIVQVGVIGVVGALLAIQFKSQKPEYGIYISVVVSIFIFLSIITRLEVIVDTVRTVNEYVSIDRAYLGTLIRMLGVTYVAEFASGICKDAGYQTIAQQIEIFSKLAILTLSLPILLALLETIRAFLSH